MLSATHNTLVLSSVSEVSPGNVAVTIVSNGHGTYPLVKLGIRVNGLQIANFDSVYTSSLVTFTKVFGPFTQICTDVVVEAIGYTEQFGDIVADGNLQSITINCPESVEEIWNGLIVTPELIQLPENIRIAQLEIFNINGQLMGTQTITEGRTELNFSLSTGIYLYRLAAGNDVITRKIMK